MIEEKPNNPCLMLIHRYKKYIMQMMEIQKYSILRMRLRLSIHLHMKKKQSTSREEIMNSKELYRKLNDILSNISEEDYPEIYNIIENEIDFSDEEVYEEF